MSTKQLSISSLFMALVIILSASIFSIPVPGGHFYFNGIVIFLVGLIFPPVQAVIIAGIGSFLGDFFFYPAPMFVTLVTHSLQVLVISLIISQKTKPINPIRTIIALFIGSIIDLVGYGIGRAFIYASPEYALLKLPFDILAIALGAGVAYFIYYHTGFVRQFQRAWKS